MRWKTQPIASPIFSISFHETLPIVYLRVVATIHNKEGEDMGAKVLEFGAETRNRWFVLTDLTEFAFEKTADMKKRDWNEYKWTEYMRQALPTGLRGWAVINNSDVPLVRQSKIDEMPEMQPITFVTEDIGSAHEWIVARATASEAEHAAG